METIGVDFVAGCSEGIRDNLLHLWHYMLDDIDVHLRKELVKVSLKVTVAHLVAILELAELVVLLLDGVVGEMDELVV